MTGITVAEIKQEKSYGMGMSTEYMLSDGSRVHAYFHENGRLAQAKYYDADGFGQGENPCFKDDGSQVSNYFIENGKVMTAVTYKDDQAVKYQPINYGRGMSEEYSMPEKNIKIGAHQHSMN